VGPIGVYSRGAFDFDLIFLFHINRYDVTETSNDL
jgi:hypothetical protein